MKTILKITAVIAILAVIFAVIDTAINIIYKNCHQYFDVD